MNHLHLPTCVRLRESGWPQTGAGFYHQKYRGGSSTILYTMVAVDDEGFIACPTSDELMDALLEDRGGEWVETQTTKGLSLAEYQSSGPRPEGETLAESLANLWIKRKEALP